MKCNPRLNSYLLGINSFIFSAILSFSALACIITTFDFHTVGTLYTQILPINLMAVFLFCLAISLIFSVFFICKLSFLVPISILCYGLFLWRFQELWLSIRTLVHTISGRYSNGYSFEIPAWCITDATGVDLSPVFQLLAMLLSTVVAWTTCYKQSSFLLLTACILYFVPCVVLTNTVPEEGPLLLLIFGIFLFLMTQHTRVRSSSQGLALTLLFSLPAFLILFHMISVQSPEKYNKADQANALLHKIQGHLDTSLGASEHSAEHANTVELDQIGRLTQKMTPILTVHTPISQTYYLRGQAFDIYTGTQWRMVNSSSQTDPLKDPPGVTEIGHILNRCYQVYFNYCGAVIPVSVKTNYRESLLYLPCSAGAYTQGILPYEPYNSYYPNIEGLQEYSFDCYDRSMAVLSAFQASDSGKLLEPYLQLPDSTRVWAQEILDQLPQTSDHRTMATIIRAYVSSHGSYSLNTESMPEGTADFAQWFLESSDTGYCVHYASATTVLLRSAGIPARYVTGYKIDAIGGKNTTAYEKDAHAWVEYWEENRGWVIMEATPFLDTDKSFLGTNTEFDPPTESIDSQTENISVEDPSQATVPVPSQSESISQEQEVQTAQEEVPISKSVFSFLLRMLQLLLMLAGIVIILLWQRSIRIMLRKTALQKGSANQRAQRYWKEVQRFARRLGEKPPRSLRRLAERARFSPYRITAAELSQYHDYFREASVRLKKKAWYGRMIDRLIFALY